LGCSAKTCVSGMTCFLRCDTGPKVSAGRRRFHRRGNLRFNNHRQATSTPIQQDKQMPNTASALLDTVTEPAIAVEG
ncbi:MAG: hypothetical protein WCA23_17940, partial [Stellaceae bacterium]